MPASATLTPPAPRPARRTATPRRRPTAPRVRLTPAPTVQLTADGRLGLQRRLERLRTEVVAPLGAMIGDPHHDRRIDDDYDRAFAEATYLEQLLSEAVAIRPPDRPDEVALGSLVDVGFSDGSTERLRIVHPAEASLDAERISVDAPAARALLGHRVGDEVVVRAPVGSMTCRIVAVWQPELACS